MSSGAVPRPLPGTERGTSFGSLQSGTSERSIDASFEHRYPLSGVVEDGNPIAARSENDDCRLQVVLSRPCYRRGESLLGIVRLLSSNGSSAFSSALIFVAGKCRLDPRWHNTKTVSELYGVHPLLSSLPAGIDDHRQDTVCHYATNCAELLHHDDDDDDDDATQFVFRVDLPSDLPPSVNGSSCRYYYNVVAAATVLGSGKLLTLTVPFAVHATPTLQRPNPTRVKIGQLSFLKLPQHESLSSTTTHKRSQLSVLSFHDPANPTNHNHNNTAPVQSLRVTNQNSKPVCILNVIGGTALHPGSSLHLQFHFKPGPTFSRNDLLKCHWITARLHGAEYATDRDNGRNTTKTYQFDKQTFSSDSVYRADEVTLSLKLPLDCPVTIHTDLIMIRVACTIELMVEKEEGECECLKLELPMEVMERLEEREEEEEEEMENEEEEEDVAGEEDGFRLKDVWRDFVELSMHVTDRQQV